MLNDNEPIAIGYDQPAINYDNLKLIVAELGEEALLPEELAEYQSQQVQSPNGDTGHYANLAEQLDDVVLRKLASEIVNWVQWDEESRSDWEKRESRGIRLLGVSDKTEGGAKFEGASRVSHPLLAEAINQFHSRAIVEMWPAEGPVKAQVLGAITQEKSEQADRVEAYMNYLYTTQMPGAFEEEDQLLFRLPLSGSCFKKAYYDPLEQAICSRFVEPSDFIVPFTASDLRTAPRFTHRTRMMRNDVLKLMKSGYYRQVELGKTSNETFDYPDVKTEIDSTEGRANMAAFEEDQRHTILEMYVDYDFDSIDNDEDEDEIRVALPYIITVDRDEQKVLRIQRNWTPDDPLRKKRIYFAHYKFTPGYGFYGYGLLHLIGGLSSAATGALRALLDAAQFANLPGGYRTRDSKIKGGDTPIAPGEWREVDSSAEELSKAFFRLPYQEPSQTLFELLGYLDERGQRFAGTTENMVGEASNTAPVGTTLALIEQGSKAFTAIHKRLHMAHSQEFRIVAELCYEYLPEEGYPFSLPGVEGYVMASDFDGRVDVIPVSDPTIISTTQRIAQAQAILDLATKHPDKMSVDKAIENMLTAMRVPNAQEFLINEPNPMGQQMQMLQVQELKAKVDKLNAEKTVKNIEGIYSAIQSAQTIVTIPGVTPVADQLLKSAGYQDADGEPVATPPAIPSRLPTRYNEQTRINIDQSPQNTDPRFPPNPASPGTGMMNGIETQGNDGIVSA